VAIATASVAALGIAIAAGYGLWHRVTPFEATDNAYVRGDLTFVAAKVPGYVVEVATENNRRVAPGQVLARIDPRDYQAAVADAEATLAQQKAAALQIDAQVQLQQAQIEVADAAVAAARAQAQRARFGLRPRQGPGRRRRGQPLGLRAGHGRGRAGPVDRDPVGGPGAFARRQLAVLDAQRQANLRGPAGRAGQALQGPQRPVQHDDHRAARRAGGRPQRAARRICRGRHAADGRGPDRALWIEANLRETQLSRIRAGDRVQIRVDAAHDQVFCGTVESLSAASGSEFSVIPPDNATGNFTKIVRRFPVRILFDARPAGLERLGSGMSVEPRIAVGSHVRASLGLLGPVRRLPLRGRRPCVAPH
jgi:membrane fusion protein (multidrug efflux system)